MTIVNGQLPRSAAYSRSPKRTTRKNIRSSLQKLERSKIMQQRKPGGDTITIWRRNFRWQSQQYEMVGHHQHTLFRKSTRADIPVLKDEQQVFTSAKGKAEKFCQTFASKCQLDSAEEPAQVLQQTTSCSKERITFRAKDIKKLLRNLQPDKATGPNEIPAKVLKDCSAELARPLSVLFELCFHKVYFQANGRRHLCTTPSLFCALSATLWRQLNRSKFRSTSWRNIWYHIGSLDLGHTTAQLTSLPFSPNSGLTPWKEETRCV